MFTKEEAKAFAEYWLPAWTGNRPEVLADFYAEDCIYLDAGCPEGIHGKAELTVYFSKILAQNPHWVWEQIEGIPLEGGFLNKWKATIPVGKKHVVCIGVCFLQFNKRGKIKRNEVYFDRAELVNEIYRLKQQNKEGH